MQKKKRCYFFKSSFLSYKGSRNSLVRNCLIQGRVSAKELVNLPKNEFTDDYFKSKLENSSSTPANAVTEKEKVSQTEPANTKPAQ